MDSIFQLDEAARALYLQLFRQSFGCTYICLWSYRPSPSNCLIYKDGIYHEETNQPSSSSASLARRLFDEYQISRFSILDNDICFPGFAFKNRIPYTELTLLQLLPLTIEPQKQFYQEARIKTVIFMGCKTGEIELGFINETHMNTEMQMRNWFPEDFSTSSPLNELLIPKPDQNPEYSSSSSLRSLSLGSPDSSSILFNFPAVTSNFQERVLASKLPTTKPTLVATSRVNTNPNPYQQAMQALDSCLTTQEIEQAAIRSAYLAVISSLPPPASSHNPIQQALPYNNTSDISSRDAIGNVGGGAFQKYNMEDSARHRLSPTRANKSRVKSLFKRAVFYFRSMQLEKIHERRGTRPTSSNQMHHMIAERRRREKLNESYDALRSLLPPGSKKDKASVLASTMEYMTTLKAQLSKLSRQNQLLEAKLSTNSTPRPLTIREEARTGEASVDFSSERLDVLITPVSGSTSSEDQLFDITMIVRGDFPIMDFIIRVLEFLKQVDGISLLYMEADPRTGNRSLFRLKFEGDEWDKSAFMEALKRIVADLVG